MKAVVQRCHRAHVEVDGKVVGRIDKGLVIFLGIMATDNETHAARLAAKIAALRIFSDADGKFNFAVGDISGSILLISNFTVCGDARKGNRPSFSAAAPAAQAEELYERFAKLLKNASLSVESGVFAADMKVYVENDGPVSIIVEAA